MENIITKLLLSAVVITAVLILAILGEHKKSLKKKQKKMMLRILISSALLLALQFVSADTFNLLDMYLFIGSGRILRLILYFTDYLIIGYDILKRAFNGIKNKRLLDENFLMAVATLGALSLAIYENGEYLEAVAVMLFYQIGEWFQGYAVSKSRKSIGELMDIRPDYANIEENGKLKQVSPDTVKIGGTIVVCQGERIPIDGVIQDGSSTIDTSSLTGESLPKDASIGDTVFSGCINLNGVLKIKTTCLFENSTASKILDLVENASFSKSKSESFISKFAMVYTPVVCGLAVALALIPPIISLIMGLSASWGMWLYRALTFLVISCPCALVISIPLSFFAGLGGASSAGILIKGSDFIERLSSVKYVVFDKTGTLTEGKFEVRRIFAEEATEELLEYAAIIESTSSHPIAKSILRAYGKEPDRTILHDVKELSGRGITAFIGDKSIAAGNGKLMRELQIKYRDTEDAGTAIHIAIDRKYAGYILISDIIKQSSKAALSELKKLGISKTVMLTGDGKHIAEKIATELKIGSVYSELLPQDKVEITEKLILEKKSGEMLAFVGDGINDAPVLARADIGIAMGAIGSDAAIEAADVVIMDDNPIKISKAIRISRKCLGIVYQNIIFALAVKLLCLILGAFGIANMYLAIFADVGVMVLAVLNAIRCLFVKKL